MNARSFHRAARSARLAWRGFALAVVWLSGCGTQDLASTADHLEHEIPAHRPADFPSAVAALETRFAEFAPNSATTAADTRRVELRDIVRWLPEIAGDSDLRKQQWEQACACAAEMERVIESPMNEQRAFSDAEQARLGDLLNKLKSLVPSANKQLNGAP